MYIYVDSLRRLLSTVALVLRIPLVSRGRGAISVLLRLLRRQTLWVCHRYRGGVCRLRKALVPWEVKPFCWRLFSSGGLLGWSQSPGLHIYRLLSLVCARQVHNRLASTSPVSIYFLLSARSWVRIVSLQLSGKCFPESFLRPVAVNEQLLSLPRDGGLSRRSVVICRHLSLSPFGRCSWVGLLRLEVMAGV